jgi:hypothetical protein
MNWMTPELEAKIKAEREARAAEVAKIWRDGLSYKDWLFDGHPINSKVMIARFNNLEWEKAWIDLGPSVAGNLGPYWHVPLKETWIDGELYDDGETVHRLYPKVLKSKWALLILHACNESARRYMANDRLTSEPK